jgi:hypothetical protein
MRTPREILLHRHRAAGPRLDALRRAVVQELGNKTAAKQSPRFVSLLLCFPRNFWREVIRPARRIWAGLAAAWLLILMANLEFRAGTPQLTAATSPNSANFLMALREQEQLMAWITERPGPKPAGPPKPSVPQPRSERRGEFLMI